MSESVFDLIRLYVMLGFLILVFFFVKTFVAFIKLKIAQKKFYPRVSHVEWSMKISDEKLLNSYKEVFSYKISFEKAWVKSIKAVVFVGLGLVFILVTTNLIIKYAH